jgi:hypothetical protein
MAANSDTINNFKRGGRPFSDIWNHMLKGPKQSKGHYSATCNSCGLYWKHGKPYILREHLANHCKKCPKELGLYYASIVGRDKGMQNIEDENISSESDEPPIKKSKQTAMSNFFEPKKLEKGKIDEIDRIITKAFIMSNIPFSTIENPWFFNLIKTLQPAYDVPSRRVLGGSLLQAELARTNIRIENELNKKNNFTIGKNYIIITLILINDLN